MTQPTTKRYFYTCPLKAAFMAKYYGMRFEPISDIASIREFMWHGIGNFIGLWEEDRYYIHPDSLHLLEPKNCDLGTDGFDAYRYEHWDEASVPGRWVLGRYGNASDPSAIRIVCRNGEAFHMPEVEE